jgi:hypothetical protein
LVARRGHVEAEREEVVVTGPPINIHIHSPLSRRQYAQLREALKQEEPMEVVPVKAAPAKPGWQTTEWWATVLLAVGSVAASATNNLPPRYAEFASAFAVFAYALSRGLAKH